MMFGSDDSDRSTLSTSSRGDSPRSSPEVSPNNYSYYNPYHFNHSTAPGADRSDNSTGSENAHIFLDDRSGGSRHSRASLSRSDHSYLLNAKSKSKSRRSFLFCILVSNIATGMIVIFSGFLWQELDAMLMMPRSMISTQDLDIPQQQENPHYLEQLMFRYGSDKSKDDHSYTDFYQMIFNPIRLQVQNITEVGTSAGQSIQAWYHYFPNAQIHAIDWETLDSMAKIASELDDRVHYQEANLLEPGSSLLQDFGLADSSMDIIIEDAMHAPRQQQDFLVQLWPLVKPGGYYVIEDIAYPNEVSRWWHEEPDKLPPSVQEILQNNDAVFIDTHTGHRAWKEWQKRAGGNAQNHVMHNSYLLAIRKRVTPTPLPVSMNLRRVAMMPGQVQLDVERDA